MGFKRAVKIATTVARNRHMDTFVALACEPGEVLLLACRKGVCQPNGAGSKLALERSDRRNERRSGEQVAIAGLQRRCAATRKR